jgi:hypothetical protein
MCAFPLSVAPDAGAAAGVRYGISDTVIACHEVIHNGQSPFLGRTMSGNTQFRNAGTLPFT